MIEEDEYCIDVLTQSAERGHQGLPAVAGRAARRARPPLRGPRRRRAGRDGHRSRAGDRAPRPVVSTPRVSADAAARVTTHVTRLWADRTDPDPGRARRILSCLRLRLGVAATATWIAPSTWSGLVPARPIAGMTVDVHELPGRTPVIVIEVPAFDRRPRHVDPVLLYGHLDKQPEMDRLARRARARGQPVLEGDRLYGRGGADDGYATFACARRASRPSQAPAAAPPALRRADRGQRGERQPRPAGPRRGARRPASARRASWCASTRAASTTTACGSRRRCAAWSAGSARRSTCLDRGRPLRVGQRRRAVDVPHRPPAARPHRGRSTGGVTARRAARRRSRPTASPRPRRPRRELGADRRPTSRSLDGAQPMTDDPAEQLLGTHLARRARASPAPTACRRSSGPATCCGRPRRCELSLRLPPTCDPSRGSARAAPRAAPPTRRTARTSASTAAQRRRAGTRRRSRRGCGPRCDDASRAAFGRRRGVRRGRHDPVHGDARRAVPRRPVRRSPACSARTPTPTDPTSSSTWPWPAASPPVALRPRPRRPRHPNLTRSERERAG